MAVTLEWVRDNYDDDKDRYIGPSENWKAMQDHNSGLITLEQQEAVQLAYSHHTLLPEYSTPPPSGVTLEWIRDNYDADKNRFIDVSENWKAAQDYNSGSITTEQQQAVQNAYTNNTLLPEYSTPPPNMETRTVSLTEGTHTIQVSLNGYDTLNATINVTATGVTCVSVIGGACGGSGLPRVSTSGLTVSTYLKEVTTTSSYATWLAGKGGLTNVELSDIFELKDAFIGLTNIEFAPTLQQIMECKDAFIGL